MHTSKKAWPNSSTVCSSSNYNGILFLIGTITWWLRAIKKKEQIYSFSSFSEKFIYGYPAWSSSQINWNLTQDSYFNGALKYLRSSLVNQQGYLQFNFLLAYNPEILLTVSHLLCYLNVHDHVGVCEKGNDLDFHICQLISNSLIDSVIHAMSRKYLTLTYGNTSQCSWPCRSWWPGRRPWRRYHDPPRGTLLLGHTVGMRITQLPPPLHTLPSERA